MRRSESLISGKAIGCIAPQRTSGRRKNRKTRLKPLNHNISQKAHLHVLAFTAKPLRVVRV